MVVSAPAGQLVSFPAVSVVSGVCVSVSSVYVWSIGTCHCAANQQRHAVMPCAVPPCRDACRLPDRVSPHTCLDVRCRSLWTEAICAENKPSSRRIETSQSIPWQNLDRQDKTWNVEITPLREP